MKKRRRRRFCVSMEIRFESWQGMGNRPEYEKWRVYANTPGEAKRIAKEELEAEYAKGASPYARTIEITDVVEVRAKPRRKK